jgi:hypothetical protein
MEMGERNQNKLKIEFFRELFSENGEKRIFIGWNFSEIFSYTQNICHVRFLSKYYPLKIPI